MATSVVQKLMFSSVTTVVIFGAAELGLMSAGWPQMTTRGAHNSTYWTADPNLDNYDMPHNEERTSFQVTTDENGLRVPIHEVDKLSLIHI